ncbi:MAG: AMP-binding protein [Solirubrobacteraceae bacterium]|nr:AMP-binding protein [Solirubrobacteraceae bacterium]
MRILPGGIAQSGARLGAAAQNALEVVRLGGLDTGDDHSPFDVVHEQRVYRLRHYFPDADGPRPAILLVPPLMLAAEVYDVSTSSSAVQRLDELGLDPWVVDFGAPEREEGGMERTLTDHVVAVSDAVERVREATGCDVHLAGYSQGGMFCYQAAAYRRSEGLASIITFGSPVDIGANIPLGIPERLAGEAATFLANHVFDAGRSLPAWASSTGFRLLDPVKTARSQLDFLLRLHDREALLPREGQRRFLNGEGFVAWSGPALADLLRQFVAQNRMLSGGIVIDDRLVTLADITAPVLAFVGEVDSIATPRAVRGIARAAPQSECFEIPLPAGHFGLVVGGAARRVTMPAVADWINWRDGRGEPPEALVPIDPEAEDDAPVAPRVGTSIELASDVGVGVVRSLRRSVRGTLRTVRGIADGAASQLPRLFRLEGIQPQTRISLGLLLDEQAQRAQDDVLFLFEDRAHTHGAVKERIDNVVRGLVRVGVRQGQHVGVLMAPRPSALTVVAALSRIGAVAVLMRPDGDLALEAEIGQIERVVADPEMAVRASDALSVEVLVLGGGGEPRDLGPLVVDLERIDPAKVRLPSWYRPNQGRAVDHAFTVFTGEGRRTRAKRISNHRWALSAFGTAAAAELTPKDTVYAVTPLHHPSALLMSVGGAVASGARIALSREYSPSTFWDEVRRYGVTVVSYTWTSARALVDAPPSPVEQHHPIRLFIGSGMPRGLWLRTLERFSTAGVLEFYASTEGDAVLANVSGQKPGAKGRRLPGSSELRLAAWDPEVGGLVEGADGFVLPAVDGDIGMLLTRVRTAVEAAPGNPLRGVFKRGDAWHVTGDLFRRDAEGDYWLVDHAAAATPTEHGLVYAFPVIDALDAIPDIDLAVAYQVRGAGRRRVAVAAVTLRDGRELAVDDVTGALAALDVERRPDVVHVVDDLPVTTWYRPITSGLRDAGLPDPGDDRAWAYEPSRDRYEPLTAERRAALLGEDVPEPAPAAAAADEG